MNWNPYKRLTQLIVGSGTDVGLVLSTEPDGATVEMVDGAQVRVRGAATVGSWVYVRGGAIEGPAPALAGETIEV